MQPTDLLRRGLSAGTLGTYLPTRLTDEYVDAALVATLVVVKGSGGIDLVSQVRERGVNAPILLDPAEYEPRRSKRPRRSVSWREEQARIGAVGFVSPGAFLATDNASAWQQLIDREADWCRTSPDAGYLSVCVATDALLACGEQLGELLLGAGLPVWLSLAHSNDPLAKSGAVRSLVRLLQAVPRISLMRSDVAAIGAVAHGAELGSIGVSSTTRHVSTGGGGGAMSGQPSVFVPTLLDWKKPEVLLGWVQRDADVEYDLVCLEACCEGLPLTRFADPALASHVVRHNMAALSAVHESVIGIDEPDGRTRKFASLVGHASFQADRLADQIPGIRPSYQIKQWRDLAG